jgi:hypothetical protein
LSAELSAVPDIDAVGITSGFPAIASRRDIHSLWVKHEGKSVEASTVQLTVDRGFFNVLRLSPLRGELAVNRELTGAVVSEAFARHYGSNVLGLQVRIGDTP